VMRSFQGHTSYVKAVAFSADGTRAVTGGADQAVRVWDVATGQELGVFRKHEDTVVRVAFTPQGKATASGSRDGDVRVWVPKKSFQPSAVGNPPAVGAPPVAAPVREALRPAAVIPVGGTVTSLHLSPNGRWLYYLNLTDGKAGRVDTAS